MSWRRIMLAVAAPSGVGPIETGKALRLAAGLAAELELFHCIFDRRVARPGRFATRGAQAAIRDLVERRHQQLERTAQRLRASGAHVRTSVRWDYPSYEGIVRQVLRRRPDLLIVQSTRTGRAARLLPTRTDYKLIESCPCPLLLIKTRRPYSDPVIVAAVDPQRRHAKPGMLDAEILTAANTACAALAGKLLVFHATTPWEEVLRASPELRNVSHAVIDDVQSAYRNKTAAEVLALTPRLAIPPEHVRIVEGDAAEALTAFARGEMADVVTLGAVPRSLVRRALVGHTAERVLDALDCDVLVVKPAGFRSAVKRQSTHHVERSAGQPSRIVW